MFKQKLLVLAVTSLELCGASCRSRLDAQAPGAHVPGVEARCTNGAGRSQGAYRYENNQWGYDKAHGAFEQCLLERRVEGALQHGWSWNWPGVDPSVFAYPEIIFGWKPWTGGTSSDPRFPLKLSQMQQLSIRYEVETEATGSYNLAPEVWLIRSRSPGGLANPGLISAEVMFWVEAAGVAQPAGRIVERPSIAGLDYELWLKDGAGVEGTRAGWRLLSFKQPKQRAGTIPVSDLLRWLAANGYVNSEHYVADVEFGNEISGGLGTTWVKTFAVDVSP